MQGRRLRLPTRRTLTSTRTCSSTDPGAGPLPVQCRQRAAHAASRTARAAARCEPALVASVARRARTTTVATTPRMLRLLVCRHTTIVPHGPPGDKQRACGQLQLTALVHASGAVT